VIPPTGTAPMPSRSYDELIELSMHRGRRLRRRRRMLTTMPAVTALVAVGLIGIPSLASQVGNGSDKLKVVTPANSVPDHGQRVRPSQRSDTRPTRGASAAAPSTARQPGLATGTAQVGGAAPTAGLGDPHRLSPGVVTFDDAVGDGTPQGASAPGASQPALDIIKMSFTADGTGIRITMQLAGTYRDDGLYYGSFTDRATGCTYTGIVGGAYHDSISWSCGSSSANKAIPGTVDPRSDLLESYVPYDLMNADVRGTDVFTELDGSTAVAGAAKTTYDTASTAKVLKQQ
jgi:hypothetical protein